MKKLHLITIPLLLLATASVSNAATPPSTEVEDCGWLVQSGDELTAQPDSTLKPRDPAAIPSPPAQAKAAYCNRETLRPQLGDQRLLKLGLPLVIRSGGNEGVLEAAPGVVFNYHPIGDKYLPGRVRPPAVVVEDCGWLVQSGDELTAHPDTTLKPRDPEAIPSPPAQTKAAYCNRETLTPHVGDQRLIKLGLPLVIRSGGSEGVLEYPPNVMFNYHLVGDKYLPGRARPPAPH